MSYKTYTQKLNSLRQDIIASIKETLRKKFGAGNTWDIKDHALMCDRYEVWKVSTDWVTIKPVYPIKFNIKSQPTEKIKLEQMSTDDLRRLHSMLETGSELI